MLANRWRRAFALLVAAFFPFTALAWDRGEVERFATLPAGSKNPEGITADRHGNIYVTTFDPTGTPPGRLIVFNRHGELLRNLVISPASGALLDLAFHPQTGALLVIDIGAAMVRRVNPLTGAAQDFAAIPGGAAAGPNVLTFDGQGNVYISDSFQGIIWKTGPNGGAPVAWASSDLLKPNGVPPFGANGLAFNKAGDTLFVANTSTDRIIRIPFADPTKAEVFVDSVNGADGLIIDKHDNLWICANQADEIVVVEPKQGRVIAKLGDFNGLTRRGAPRGLLFPASLVRVGDWIYVTNLSLDIKSLGFGKPVDAPWAAEVKRQTIARLKAKIPPVSGRDNKRDDRKDDD